MSDEYICGWLVAETLEYAPDNANLEKVVELIHTAFKYRRISE